MIKQEHYQGTEMELVQALLATCILITQTLEEMKENFNIIWINFQFRQMLDWDRGEQIVISFRSETFKTFKL